MKDHIVFLELNSLFNTRWRWFEIRKVILSYYVRGISSYWAYVNHSIPVLNESPPGADSTQSLGM